jgi:hypothetical protein
MSAGLHRRRRTPAWAALSHSRAGGVFPRRRTGCWNCGSVGASKRTLWCRRCEAHAWAVARREGIPPLTQSQLAGAR